MLSGLRTLFLISRFDKVPLSWSRTSLKKLLKHVLGTVIVLISFNVALALKKTDHNYNKILKSDWLSTALISALIGQLNRTVRVMPK